jgi:hypothetical protein
MRVSFVAGGDPSLFARRLDFFTIDRERSRVFLEDDIVFYSVIEMFPDFSEDVVSGKLFLFFRGFSTFFAFEIFWEISTFVDDALSSINLGEGFDMMISPPRVRQISVPWNQIVAVPFFDVPVS